MVSILTHYCRLRQRMIGCLLHCLISTLVFFYHFVGCCQNNVVACFNKFSWRRTGKLSRFHTIFIGMAARHRECCSTSLRRRRVFGQNVTRLCRKLISPFRFVLSLKSIFRRWRGHLGRMQELVMACLY